jgi:hypothetical protein
VITILYRLRNNGVPHLSYGKCNLGYQFQHYPELLELLLCHLSKMKDVYVLVLVDDDHHVIPAPLSDFLLVGGTSLKANLPCLRLEERNQIS